MRHVVLVADMKIANSGDVLVTHALGSCLGVLLYDSKAKIGGLLHAMLPFSKVNPSKAADNPCMFIDTGLPVLLEAFYHAGGQKSTMVVKAAGCGNFLGKNEMFEIGRRNYKVLKELLMANRIELESEDIGGTENRTVHFDLSTGRVTLSNSGREWQL
jgi:chemotaxis protein CheD